MLTPREAEVLAVMKAFDVEVAYERGSGYVGNVRISSRLVFDLLRKVFISSASDHSDIGQPGHIERYRINSSGARALIDHWGIEYEVVPAEKAGLE